MTYILSQSLDISTTFTNNSSGILQTQYNNNKFPHNVTVGKLG